MDKFKGTRWTMSGKGIPTARVSGEYVEHLLSRLPDICEIRDKMENNPAPHIAVATNGITVLVFHLEC